MNPAKFQNMGQARPQPIGQQPVGMQKNGSGTSTEIRNHIFKALSDRPVPAEWQQTIGIHQRVASVHQMVTGLLILKPEMPLASAVNVAVGFETQEFSTSPDWDTYNMRLDHKLSDIHRARQNHANQQQQQFQNQQAAQMGLTQQQMTQAQQMTQNQNQFPQGFGMPQPQQPGQAVPTPMQQQYSQQQRLGNPNDIQQQIPNGQAIQGMPRPMPQNRGQPQFAPQEHQYIVNMARHMASNLSDQDKQNLQAQVRNLNPQQIQNLQAQRVNPMEFLIRNHATKKYVEERSKRQQVGQVPPNNGAIANQGRPVSQVTVRGQSQQLPPASAPQQADPTLAPSNMDQFLGQQAEALRHQEAGQVVVPASHGQGAPPQVRGKPHPQQQGQFGTNRAPQPQNNFQPPGQPFWNTPQPPQQTLQQPSQIQAQPPTPSFTNMPVQALQQQALQGQMGGLSNSQAQRTPQQVHNMPTLNQPLDLSGQKQKDQAQRTTQPTPKSNQRSGPNGPNGPQTSAAGAQPKTGQQRPQIGLSQAQWSSLPPNIREKLLSMPEDQRKQWFAQMLQKQQQQRLQAGGNGNRTGKPDNAVQSNPQGPPAGPKGGPGVGAPASNTPVSNITQPPVMNMQYQGIQPPPQPAESRPNQPKMVPIKLTPEQGQYMDNIGFPPNIINRRSELGNVPENVQTWRQLKEFVNRNAQNLPPNSLQKVIGLQSIHFQMQQQNTNNHERAQMIQQGQQGNARFPQAGIAPMGQMVPQGNQGFRQAPPPVPGQLGIPTLPEPTAQELQGARNTLPAHMRHIRDDQLRQMIQAKRQQDFLKTPQGQQALALHQQRNNMIRPQRPDTQSNQFPAVSSEPGQVQQPPRGQDQPPHPRQQRPPQQRPPTPNAQPPKPAPGSWAGVRPDPPQTGQKGMKRNSNDDVVEVPNPKLAQQQTRPPPNPRVPQPPQVVNVMPRLTREQFASLTNDQKAQYQRRMQAVQVAAQQRAAAQQNSPNAPAKRPADPSNQNVAQIGGEKRLTQLMAEVAQSTPPRQIIPMSPQTRSVMVEKLRENTGNILARFEKSVPIFLQMSKDEDQVKQLLRIRLHLLQQVQDGQFTRPLDNFTVGLKELEEYKSSFHDYSSFMMNYQGKPRPAQQPQQLSAANLQQQQNAIDLQRAASVQKSHASSNRAPAAPTTTHAPFPFGSLSPQGVPQIYAAKNELTSDKLVLPVSKKRKNNNNQASAGSTPAQRQGTPATKSSPAPKPSSPEIQRAPAVPALAKCTVEGCDRSRAGFATKEDLEKHEVEAHDPTHNIKDPMDAAMYAIESMRLVLGLDENGKCKAVVQETEQDKGVPQAPTMKTTASSQGIKQETATPMSRNPTQTGPSPSTNLLKTPQATTNEKTPASETKPLVKGATANVASASPTARLLAATELDGWANSKVDKHWFREVFGGCANLNRGVGTEVTKAYLERNPFTPPTSSSSPATSKDSPHRSDISPSDKLNFNINVDADEVGDDWVTTNSFFDDGLQGEMADLGIPDLGDIMDWEKAFEEDDDDKDGGNLQENEWGAPVEFLKIYDPEKYEACKKKKQKG